MRRRNSSLRLAPLAAALLLTACSGSRKLVDPVVVITTRNGMELGVTTQSGIVFTGATAERGEVEIEAWFGDGPTIERTIIEPVSDELFTAETDIVLPSVPISFDEPRDGESLQLMGRKDGARWSTSARVKTDPAGSGCCSRSPRASRTNSTRWGPACSALSEHRHELVGLVVGKVQLERNGSIERYPAVAGPTEPGASWPTGATTCARSPS